ncbi:MAG: hypothetical protein ACUVUC_01895 [Thermoguttaceae bacterium]
MKLARTLAALALFAIPFGYVEAAVVVYLRTLCEPLRAKTLADKPHDEIFPLLTVEQLQAAGPPAMHLLKVELGRELATLLMLGAAGLAVGSSFPRWLAGFILAFGVWDIFYYVFLKLLIDWPASLWTWDILFLLPVPWVGPVAAPVIVSVSMIAVGVLILYREAIGKPIAFRWFDWVAILAGGLLIVAAFCWDFRNTRSGGWPNPFAWPLLAAGELLGLLAVAEAWRRHPAPARAPRGCPAGPCSGL